MPNISIDEDIGTEDRAIEEAIQQELRQLTARIHVPKGIYDEPRFDADYLQPDSPTNHDSEEDDDQEDLSNATLTQEQKANYFKNGLKAYESACKSFDYCLFLSKTVTEKLMTPEVDFMMSGLGDKGCIALSRSIRANPLITSLNLSDNSITLDGVEKLMSVLRMNKSVVELDLSKNRLGNKGVSKSKSTLGESIKNMLLSNNRLKKLVLKSNNLSDSDIQDICTSLTENSTLSHLDLSYNKMGERSGAFIGQMLMNNSDLKFLSLEWNMIRTIGAIHVFTGLHSNNAVAIVKLGWNGISEGATQKLGQMLQSNIALEELYIPNNHLLGNGQAIQSICSDLKENSSLQVLDLSNNVIHEEPGLFLDTIANNESSSIKLLNLSGCMDQALKSDQMFVTRVNDITNTRKTLKVEF